MKTNPRRSVAPFLTTLCLAVGFLSVAWSAEVPVTVANGLDLARPSETISLSWPDLVAALPQAQADRLQVRDKASGKEMPCQAVDSDANGTPDEFIFQADIGPKETRAFVLATLEGPGTKFPSRAFGRFVPERKDDFAWENDRIAHRMYGAALETDKAEPLTSSGVDVWCKRTRELVIDKWYRSGDYHTDHGEGCDLYTVGKGRGAGGLGVYRDGKLLTSRNFRSWKVLAAGPVRVSFVLTYLPWEVEGVKVSEVKRVTLDAGQNLSHFESIFLPDKPLPELDIAIGVQVHAADATVALKPLEGWMSVWEKCSGNNGNLGTGAVLDPATLRQMKQEAGHALAAVTATPGKPVSYWAGAGWDKSGDFASADDWNLYLARFAQRLASPLKITLGSG